MPGLATTKLLLGGLEGAGEHAPYQNTNWHSFNLKFYLKEKGLEMTEKIGNKDEKL